MTERERETDRQTARQIETDRETERDRQIDIETEIAGEWSGVDISPFFKVKCVSVST